MVTNNDARVVDDSRTTVQVDQALPNNVTVQLDSALRTGVNLLDGTGAPLVGVGATGDYYLDSSVNELWGPKGVSVWPGVSIGKFVPTPVATYVETNVLTDRAYDADATTLGELADVLGTLIGDLRTAGLIL